MVWKLGKLQSVYNELRFYVGLASPCMHKSFEILPINISIVRLSASARQRYWTIAHYTKNALRPPSTSLHRHKQKDSLNLVRLIFIQKIRAQQIKLLKNLCREMLKI